jgi:hypothetical protein
LDADRASKGFTKMDPSTILLLMIKRIIGWYFFNISFRNTDDPCNY